jgi:Mce-associated membrane protein
VTVKNDEDVMTRVDVDGDTEIVGADVSDADIADRETAAVPPPDRPAGPMHRVLHGAARFWVAIVLVVALAVAGGVTAWLYATEYRADQQTNPAAAEAAVKAASEGTIALLSYSPDSLDADFNNARSHLTGDFLNYYNQFTEQIVTPAATKNAVQTQASVVNAAVAELHPDTAVVLVFLNQNTISTENPDGSFSTSSVKVGLAKVGDDWRIAAFDPV